MGGLMWGVLMWGAHQEARLKLVPILLKDDVFWRNYFYKFVR